MRIERGDIFFIKRFRTYGSEQQSGRPAIVVSNDVGNRYSTAIEVVYLTSQQKTPLPTHVTVYSSHRESTALCEQITSVDKTRLGEYVGHLTDEEMRAVDYALLVSLGLATEDPNAIMRGNARDRGNKNAEVNCVG